MRSEFSAVLTDPAPARETEDLIPAAVGKDWPFPPDEPMQPAGARDQVVAGSQIEVVGITKDDLSANALAQVLDVAMRDALDGALGADRHKGGRLHHSVRRAHLAAPCCAVAREHVKLKKLIGHVAQGYRFRDSRS